MASNKPKQKGSIAAPTFPVWVGNLHESVTEEILRRRFSGFGPIVSCTIMKDGTGRSKKFGYVNFSTRGNADRAAAKLAGFKFNGTAIKTKGPSSLRKEGHLKQQKDYRLLTDCSFFMNSNTCTKGKEVSFRNSPMIAFFINSVHIDTAKLLRAVLKHATNGWKRNAVTNLVL